MKFGSEHNNVTIKQGKPENLMKRKAIHNKNRQENIHGNAELPKSLALPAISQMLC